MDILVKLVQIFWLLFIHIVLLLIIKYILYVSDMESFTMFV